ncbi:MAG: dihydroorotase [Chloroflexota bacterium]
MDANAWLISGGRVVDPSTGTDRVADVVVRNGRIVGFDEPAPSLPVIDASGCVVAPGFVDLHVHLREPGGEHKETIATGTAAAAAGGFTTICCMPNTDPALDDVAIIQDLRSRCERDALVRVHPIGAITKGRRGEEPVDFAALAAAGVMGFSDDGDTTRDSSIMRQALEMSRVLNLPIMVHCEDAAGAGRRHLRPGLPGIPAEAEEIIIARDLMLARLTGGWLHVLHVSTGRGAGLVRQYKGEGVRVTAEVTPHHLVMADTWVAGSRRLLNVDEPPELDARPGDPNTKVNPPLRTPEDTRHLLAALKDGTIDIVATDHAPHAATDKEGKRFEDAAFGLSGLELALPLLLALVRARHLSLSEMVFRLSTQPARLLGTGVGTLVPGAPADVVLFDPTCRWMVTPERLKTKSKNTPLLGMHLQGRVRFTLVNGRMVFYA